MPKDKIVDLFMNDPIEYFDQSITKMHMIPRARCPRRPPSSALPCDPPG